MAELPMLENLTTEETEKLCMAPVWVTLLIAGADQKIEKKEISEAVALVQDKRHGGSMAVNKLFERIQRNFENNINGYLVLFSENGEARQEYLIGQLTLLNSLLRRVDKKFAIEYYRALMDFSRRVAAASGGIFGFGAITEEEEALIDLPMIEDPEKYSN
jgi:hypothetical protein